MATNTCRPEPSAKPFPETFMTQAIQVIRVLLLLLGLLACVQPAVAVESVTYLHNDASGSPVAATDAAGNVIWREGYRAYGERTRNETAARSNRQFFHGKAFDADSGLSYFGARYYDPVVGRFMAIDPAGFDEANLHSFNRYAYGNNNPYRYVDPNGKAALPIVIAVGLWLGAEVFGPNPVGPAHAPDAINPTSFPDGSAALKSAGLALGVIGSIERQGARLGARELADPSAIRFTQDSIGTTFKDGRSVQGLIDGLKAGKLTPNDLPPIRTFERDGLTFTLDNRRLFAASQAGVKVRTVPATAEEIAKELPRKFTTPNKGCVVCVRGSMD